MYNRNVTGRSFLIAETFSFVSVVFGAIHILLQILLLHILLPSPSPFPSIIHSFIHSSPFSPLRPSSNNTSIRFFQQHCSSLISVDSAGIGSGSGMHLAIIFYRRSRNILPYTRFHAGGACTCG
ncbi:conserved hypothetical protein [Trichinella spiralis]|uniref:hypothetical protein n=1 Tax=Trichinella spiralis TaxID=6334 RepID=UPI0001EFDBC3|nr:conserved hypothetical protein [Trichinella spiralis]